MVRTSNSGSSQIKLNPFQPSVAFALQIKWLVFIWNATLRWNGLISKKKYLHIFGLVTLTFTKLDKLDLIRCSPKIFLQWLFKKLSKDLRESTLGRFSIKKNVFMDPQALTHPEKNVSWFSEVSVTSLFYSFLGLGKPAAKTIFHKVERLP